DGLPGVLAEPVGVPLGRREADDRDPVVALAGHLVDGREDLLLGQVAGGAEEDEGVGGGELVDHVAASSVSSTPGSPSPAASSGSTAWPPNCSRSAAMARMAVPSSSWLVKRA